MFDTGSLAYIRNFVDSNVVNVVYRNNDIMNLLNDALLEIGEKIGIDGTIGLSKVFISIYLATIILYIIVHAIVDGKGLYNKFFGIFTKEGDLTKKNFMSSNFIQMFIITIFATILLMPAKMQYVTINQVPSANGVPTYVDLPDSHPKGKVIKTIAILAWSAWAQNRLIYGVATSNGPVVSDKEIEVVSLNRFMPRIFNDYFVDVNNAIDGYIYMFNFLNALKEINNLEKEEFTKYANILDSQLTLQLGQKTFFRDIMKKSGLDHTLEKEYETIYNVDTSENTKLLNFIIKPDSRDLSSLFDNWDDQTWGERAFLFPTAIGRAFKTQVVNTVDGVNSLVGNAVTKEDRFNRILGEFDTPNKTGLMLFESHVKFLEESHKRNKEYRDVVKEYIKATITGNESKQNLLNKCLTSVTTTPTIGDLQLNGECLYLDKLIKANKYLLEDTLERMINLYALPENKDLQPQFPINRSIVSFSDISNSYNASPYCNSGSPAMNFCEFSKLYFGKTLAKNQARILDKINALDEVKYPFKKGIRSIYLLNHTNFLQDMRLQHQSDSYVFTNTGDVFSDSEIGENNMVKSLLAHSSFQQDTTYEIKNGTSIATGDTIQGSTFNSLYEKNKGNNELRDVNSYSVDEGLKIKDFLSPSIDGFKEQKSALSGNYSQIDDISLEFVGTPNNSKISIDFTSLVNNGVLVPGVYNILDKRLIPIVGQSVQYIANIYTKLSPITNFMQTLTEQMLFEYLFTEQSYIYNTVLNFKSGSLTSEKFKQAGFSIDCKTETSAANSNCLYIDASYGDTLQNFKVPNGTMSYLKYQAVSGNPIKQEIMKIEYIRSAMNSIPTETQDDEDLFKKGIDKKLIEEYLNILKHFDKKGNTNSIRVTTNDELFTLFKFINTISMYITGLNSKNIETDTDVIIDGTPLRFIYNTYFYPHAMMYFEKTKSPSKTLDNSSITESIDSLYDFLRPSTEMGFTLIFGKYEKDANFAIKQVESTAFVSGDDALNKSLAKSNFYENLKLMTEMQNEKYTITTPLSTVENGELTEKSIAQLGAKIGAMSTMASMKGMGAVLAILSDELTDMLTWVVSNIGEMIAEKALKYVIEPYHFIFGKNDFTKFGKGVTTSSAVKGVFEHSNNFHMNNIKMTFALPKNLANELASTLNVYEDTIGMVILTIASIAIPIGPAGLLLGAIARGVGIVARGAGAVARGAGAVARGTRAARAARGARAAKGANRVGNKFTKFRKKSFFGKITGVGMFLIKAPYNIVSAIIGAIAKSAFLFMVVISLLLSIYTFLIQFVGRIALPLAVGYIYIILQALLYPLFYLINDMVKENFRGSFEELNNNYIAGLLSTFKTLFKTYLYYIVIIMIFIGLYKILLGVFIYISTSLMFQWGTFNLPISMIVLVTFWLTTRFMAKIIDYVLPESQMAKYNFRQLG